MKKYIGVYMLTEGDRAYIGASSDIKRRWSVHMALMKNGTHLYFKELNNIKFEILEECSTDELPEREEYWMGYMAGLFNVVNKSKAGKIPFNSEEAKLIKSMSQQGIKNGHCRLSEQDVFVIRQLYRDGDYTQAQLAEIFSVSTTHICSIINGKRWGCLISEEGK